MVFSCVLIYFWGVCLMKLRYCFVVLIGKISWLFMVNCLSSVCGIFVLVVVIMILLNGFVLGSLNCLLVCFKCMLNCCKVCMWDFVFLSKGVSCLMVKILFVNWVSIVVW